MKTTQIRSTNEFLSTLATIQNDFEWFLTKKKNIRGRLKADNSSPVFDPLTAVAYIRTHHPYLQGQWHIAATDIGLSYNDCADIIAAFDYDWDPSSRQGRIRIDLLRAVFPSEPVRVSSEVRTRDLLPHLN